MTVSLWPLLTLSTLSFLFSTFAYSYTHTKGPIIGGQLGGLGQTGTGDLGQNARSSRIVGEGLPGFLLPTWVRAAAPYIFSVLAFAADLLVLRTLPNPPLALSAPVSTSVSTSAPPRAPVAEGSDTTADKEKEKDSDSDNNTPIYSTATAADRDSKGDDSKDKGVTSQGRGTQSVLMSLPFLLHLKFAFQSGNTIYVRDRQGGARIYRSSPCPLLIRVG